MLIFLVIILLILAAIFIRSLINIIGPDEKGIIETMGKFTAVKDSGVVLVFPVFQNLRRVYIKEQKAEYMFSGLSTKDNQQISAKLTVVFRIIDPQKALYGIANVSLAIAKLSEKQLENIIRKTDLTKALEYGFLNDAGKEIEKILADAGRHWGTEIIKCEITEIK